MNTASLSLARRSPLQRLLGAVTTGRDAIDWLFAALVIAGGLKKNRMLMQIYADVTGRPLSILDAEQGPALGSAMHAAVAAGAYPDIAAAAGKMSRFVPHAYTPIPANVATYDRLYTEYLTLHDYFGRGLNDVMKRLKALAGAASRAVPSLSEEAAEVTA